MFIDGLYGGFCALSQCGLCALLHDMLCAKSKAIILQHHNRLAVF